MRKKKKLDREESVSLMEPMLLRNSLKKRPALTELAFELASKSATLRSSLPQNMLLALANLVRVMNCYYSNLIEGHDTHPVDIEKALKEDYSKDKRKRNLQLEAKAHIAVQKWIDEGGLGSKACSVEGILEIHEMFYKNVPSELLRVKSPKTGRFIDITPGAFRKLDVQVGKHIPVSPGSVPRFMDRYSNVYSSLKKAESVLNAAGAHHRLLWIHPFLDGNGRVARLVSYAQLLNALESAGIWSIARGLARNVQAYKQHLVDCDNTRWNDLDGRGNLSEGALGNFTEFFLTTCLDQVNFMTHLIEPNLLHSRIMSWVELEVKAGNLYSSAPILLEAVLYRGEIARSEIPGILSVQERQARRITKGLLEAGVLTSSNDRAPLKIDFPANLASHFMPGLFPPA